MNDDMNKRRNPTAFPSAMDYAEHLEKENDSLKAQVDLAVKYLQDIRWSWENDAGRQCDNLAYEALESILEKK